MKEYLEIILLLVIIVAVLFFIILGIYGILGSRKRNKLMEETNQQMRKNASDPVEMMEMSKLHTKKSLEHMDKVEKQLDRIATALENSNK